MNFGSPTKKSVLGALALGAAGMAAIAPAQASHFDDDGYRQEVVVVKKSVAHPIHDFEDDEDFGRPVVVKKRVYDEDDDFDRPEPVIVTKQVVQPVTVVKRVVQPVKVIVKERLVQPVTVVKRIVQPVKVVKERIVHSAYAVHRPRRASYRFEFHPDF